MKTKLLLLLFLFASYNVFADDGSVSVVNVRGNKVTVCSLDKVKKSETIHLSSLVESCKLIHFEDIDDALFKPWFTTVTNKYIGVRQQGNGAFKLFSSSGKFLCDVGAVGQGPGEYSIAIYDEIIDDKNELVYLAPMTGSKILVYSTSGKFIKNIDAKQDLNKPKLHLDDNGVLTVIHMTFDPTTAFAIQFDSKGQIIKKLLPPSNLIASDFDGEIFNTRNTKNFDFYHTNSDTLYHYNVKDNKIQPVLTMTAPKDQFKQYYELNNFFVINAFGKGLVFTNKKTNTSSFVKIVNDYFGNLEMPGHVLNFRDGQFVYNLEPAELKDKITKHLAEGKVNEQDKQKLNKLLSELDEDANNVLFVGKLK